MPANAACPTCALGALLDPRDDLVGLIPEAWELPEELRFVDEYLLLEQLGSGGMGDVFRARSVHSHQFVALKLLKPSVRPERSDLEIRTLAEATHPGIVRFLRRGRVADREWYAMELVEGVHLGTLSAPGRPLDPHRAAEYVAEAAEAIEFVHTSARRSSRDGASSRERGPILHRDLKPSNLLLDPFGRIKVIDFGLAKHLDSAAAITLAEQFLGTPEYAAPEQVDRSLGDESVRTDVYGLGATLYQLLTGHPPHIAESKAQVLVRVQQEDPRPPRHYSPSLPADLEAICLRCLARHPAKRYATAAEVAADLRRWLRGEPTRARPVGPLGRLVKWSRRRPVLTAAATLLALVLLGWSARESHNRRERDRTEVILALAESQQALRQGDTLAALARLGRGLQLHPADRALAEKTANVLRHASLWIPVGTRDLPPGAEIVVPETLAPDTNRFWFGADRELRVAHGAGSPPAHLVASSSNRLQRLAVVPAADVVVAATETELLVVRESTGDLVHRGSHAVGAINGLRVLPDGLLLLGGLRGVECRTAATGGLRWRRALPEPGLLGFAASPARQVVIGVTTAGAFLGWRLGDGTALPRTPAPLDGVPRACVVSPDGTRLFTATHNGRLHLWTFGADGLEPSGQATTTVGPVRTGSWSPDGRWIVVAGDAPPGEDAGFVQGWSASDPALQAPAWQTSLPHASGEQVRFSGDAELTFAAIVSDSGTWAIRSFRTLDGTPADEPLRSMQPIQTLGPDTTGERLLAVLEGTPTSPPRVARWQWKSAESLASPTNATHAIVPPAQPRPGPGHSGVPDALGAISPSGRLRATAHAGQVQILEAARGRVMATLEHGSTVSAVAFDRDERRVATGTAERRVHLWDLETRQELAAPLASTVPVTDVGFTATGDRYGTPTATAPDARFAPGDASDLGRLALAVAAARSERDVGDLTAAEEAWAHLEARFLGTTRLQILTHLVQDGATRR